MSSSINSFKPIDVTSPEILDKTDTASVETVMSDSFKLSPTSSLGSISTTYSNYKNVTGPTPSPCFSSRSDSISYEVDSDSLSRRNSLSRFSFSDFVSKSKERYSPILHKSFSDFREGIERSDSRRSNSSRNSSRNCRSPELQKLKDSSLKERYNKIYNKIFDKHTHSSFSLYQNSFDGGKLGSSEVGVKILGGPDLREDRDALKNFGTLASQKPLKDVGQSILTNGSILYDSSWNVFTNDIAMVGAIHGNQTFFIWNNPDPGDKQQALPSDDVLFDNLYKRPRVTGRELLMLELAGYKKLDYPFEEDLGIVLVCVDSSKSKNFELDKFDCDSSKLSHIHRFLENSISMKEYKEIQGKRSEKCDNDLTEEKKE